MTSTPTPRKPFITASLAEQVLAPVSTKTRGRLRVGRACPVGTDGPTAEARNSSGVMAAPVTGSVEGFLLLNCVSSNVWPAVTAGPATMYALSLIHISEPT